MSADFSEWFASSAQCAHHPHSEAIGACRRCGSFGCEACMSDQWCTDCAPIVLSDHLPGLARSVVWKLLIGPAFLIVSGAIWLSKGRTVPLTWLAWLVPILCAAVVLKRKSPAAAWFGVLTTLLLLATQAINIGAGLRLIDVGLLAIAPVLAIDGAARLSRVRNRVKTAAWLSS